MCDRCVQLRTRYHITAEKLGVAQRELARYSPQDQFIPRWSDCERALRELWRLREEMAAHAASHNEGLPLATAAESV